MDAPRREEQRLARHFGLRYERRLYFLVSARKTEGTPTGFESPLGECTDKNNDVFITDELESEILEYAHGGTRPIAILRVLVLRSTGSLDRPDNWELSRREQCRLQRCVDRCFFASAWKAKNIR